MIVLIMATDPICGMFVDEHASNIISSKDGRKYYFCSSTCKLQFEKPEKEMHELRKALIVALPLTIAVFALTYAVKIAYADYIMLVLASIVQFYAGMRFYYGIADAIRNRSANMDTLIAIGTSAAWAYSATITLLPRFFAYGGVYFDTSTVIISLILVGTYMQRIAEEKATNAISSLAALQPKIAHLVDGDKITDVNISGIKIGDILLVKPGETVPTDSKVIEGDSSVDESMITGESMPVSKKNGNSVTGGTINVTGALKVEVTKIGDDTTLAQILRIVRDAASSKVPIQRLADTIASYFVPTVIAISIIAALFWYFAGNVGLNVAFLIFVSVLIIACPCALGIATPAALMVASGKAAKSGILIKSGESLQIANKINVIVMDKTGTLTKGKPEVAAIISAPAYTKDEVLRLAATAEINSEHVIGRAIVEKAVASAIKPEIPDKFEYVQGSGVRAHTPNGINIIVGSRAMFEKEKEEGMWNAMTQQEYAGRTTVIVGVNDKPIGIISLEDMPKADSKEAIGALQKSGKEIWLVTGDNARVANAIATELGIRNVMAEAKPQDKLAKIEELQKQGKLVAMVGDGINDAPALTKANLGIAMGSGTDIAMQAGSIIITGSNMYNIVTAFELGRATMTKIKQNLMWAFGYNIILIPVAAGVLIPVFTTQIYDVLPMLAGAAMAFSSVTVVTNSLLLKIPKRVGKAQINSALS